MSQSTSVKIEPLVYSLAQAGQALGLSERSVRRRISDRTLRSVKIGKRVVIPRREIDRLLGLEIESHEGQA